MGLACRHRRRDCSLFLEGRSEDKIGSLREFLVSEEFEIVGLIRPINSLARVRTGTARVHWMVMFHYGFGRHLTVVLRHARFVEFKNWEREDSLETKQHRKLVSEKLVYPHFQLVL